MSDKRVDEDWKREAHAERAKDKEKLSPKEKEKEKSGDVPGGRTPFIDFINALATEVLMFLGAVAHPQTGQAVYAPEQAKHTIDILGMLEEKTRGNLTPDEERMLKGVLHEIRLAYVRASQSPPPTEPEPTPEV